MTKGNLALYSDDLVSVPVHGERSSIQEIWVSVAEVENGRVSGMCRSMTRTIALVSELLPHEQIIPEHLREILDVFKDGRGIPPILIDRHSKTILDGHHRFHMARLRGWKTIECLQVDYRDDDAIRVLTMRDDYPVSKEDVIRSALSQTLMRPKTSKHLIKCDFNDLAT